MSARLCARLLLSLSLLLSLAILFGCKKDQPATSSGQPSAVSGSTGNGTAGSGGDLMATGKAVYDRSGCANCHSVGGAGGRSAPDLSKVGAEPGHTTEWLVAHVRNPKAHNPRSRMPSFEGRISDQDLLALGAYLASLR